jgi:periplasmic protein TonB
MNSISHSYRVAHVTALGLLVSLAGCANAPTRHATTETFSTPTAVATNLADNLEPPVPMRTVAPQYPFEMRRAGLTGKVNITGVIDESGRASDLKAENASDHRFVQPSLRAVGQWTFKPAQRDGVPITTRVRIPIEYMLDPQ